MSLAYKGFTLNKPGDPTNWAAVEQTAFKDIVDTLVIGTCTSVKSVTNGHRHPILYNTIGTAAALTADADANVSATKDMWFPDGYGVHLGGSSLAAYDGRMIYDSNKILIETRRANEDIHLKSPSSGSILLEIEGGGAVEIGIGASAPASQFGKSVIFYVEGSDLKARYFDGVDNYTTGTVCSLT